MKDRMLKADKLYNLNYSVYVNEKNEISYYIFHEIIGYYTGYWDVVENRINSMIINYSGFDCALYKKEFDDGSILYKLIFNEESELNRYILEIL